MKLEQISKIEDIQIPLPQSPSEDLIWHVGAALQEYAGPTEMTARRALGALFEVAQISCSKDGTAMLTKTATPLLIEAVGGSLVGYVDDKSLYAASQAVFSATVEFLSNSPALMPLADEIGQSNSAAERSAHVVRGNLPKEERRWPIRQLRDGSWRLNVVVEREEEILALRVALQEIAIRTGAGDEAVDGAREIARAALIATSNSQRPVVDIVELGGNCPVQAEGTIAGKPFFFRARGSSWRLSVGDGDPIGNPEWTYQEDYGENYEAGWMEEKEAIRFILQAADQYQATRPVAQQPGPVGAR